MYEKSLLQTTCTVFIQLAVLPDQSLASFLYLTLTYIQFLLNYITTCDYQMAPEKGTPKPRPLPRSKSVI